MIQGLVVEAIARDALGDPGAVGRALELALDLAEPEGLLLPFLLFPAPELLERHARSRTAHAALLADVRTLLAGRRLGRTRSRWRSHSATPSCGCCAISRRT